MDNTRTCNKCNHKFRDPSTLRRHQARLTPCSMAAFVKKDAEGSPSAIDIPNSEDKGIQQLTCILQEEEYPLKITDLKQLAFYRGRISDELISCALGSRIRSAFAKASGAGLLEAMTLLKKWGVLKYTGYKRYKAYDTYDDGFVDASKKGQTEAMLLLQRWGARNYDEAFIKASKKGQIEAMTFLKDWGARIYDSAFLWASRKGQIEAMKLLKKMGCEQLR